MHEDPKPVFYGMLGIHQLQIPCIIGIHPEERKQEQTIIVDVKIKVDLARCIMSGRMQDTVDYVQIAQLCTQLAQEKQYLLVETLASDILAQCLHRFQSVWAWVRIQKPSAIPLAAYAYVELERDREGQK